MFSAAAGSNSARSTLGTRHNRTSVMARASDESAKINRYVSGCLPRPIQQGASDQRTADGGHGVGEVEVGEHAGAFFGTDRLEEQQEHGQLVGRPGDAGQNLHQHQKRERIGNQPQCRDRHDAHAAQPQQLARAEADAPAGPAPAASRPWRQRRPRSATTYVT